MFDDLIRTTWWKIFATLIANRRLKEGEHYLFSEGKLFLSFKPVYEQYINYIMDSQKPRELLITTGSMRSILSRSENYMYHSRKRISSEHNVNTMVFRWSN